MELRNKQLVRCEDPNGYPVGCSTKTSAIVDWFSACRHIFYDMLVVFVVCLLDKHEVRLPDFSETLSLIEGTGIGAIDDYWNKLSVMVAGMRVRLTKINALNGEILTNN